jgi:excisionase family DNA binding protein
VNSVSETSPVAWGAPEPWLTKREVASYLRISTRTVERQDLPFVRVGGQNRYRLSAVKAELEARGHSDSESVERRANS